MTFSSHSRACSWLSTFVALTALVVACGEDGDGKTDDRKRADAGDAGRDASRQNDAGNKDGAVGSDDETFWRCNLNDYGCYCSAKRTRPLDGQACDTSGCCILVQRPGEGTCACLSTAGAQLRQQACGAWLDEQMAGCAGAECKSVESCPPGTPPVKESDAGRDAGAEQDARVVEDAAADSGTGDGGVPPIPNQGEFQHCVYSGGCFEFRSHRPSCYEGNQLNCQNAFSGTYDLGKCPGANYKQTIIDQTSCGETASYVK